MKKFVSVLLTLSLSTAVFAGHPNSDPAGIFEFLHRRDAAYEQLSDQLKEGYKPSDVWVDPINNVACIVSEERAHLFFIYTEAFGFPAAPMKSGNGFFLSTGTSMYSGDIAPSWVILKCFSRDQGKASFQVKDLRSGAVRVVSFTVRAGREEFQWKD